MVRDARPQPGIRFDYHAVARLRQFFDPRRQNANPILVAFDFPRHADDQPMIIGGTPCADEIRPPTRRGGLRTIIGLVADARAPPCGCH